MDEATMELGETIATLQDHHFAMARQMYPHGTTLECEKCCRRQTVTAGEFATILGHRWPTCCGQTMHLADADETIPLNRESILATGESIPLALHKREPRMNADERGHIDSKKNARMEVGANGIERSADL